MHKAQRKPTETPQRVLGEPYTSAKAVMMENDAVMPYAPYTKHTPYTPFKGFLHTNSAKAW